MPKNKPTPDSESKKKTAEPSKSGPNYDYDHEVTAPPAGGPVQPEERHASLDVPIEEDWAHHERNPAPKGQEPQPIRQQTHEMPPRMPTEHRKNSPHHQSQGRSKGSSSDK